MNYLLSTGKGRIQISNQHSIVPKVSMLSNVHPPIPRAICSLLWEARVVKSGASSKVPDRAMGGARGPRAHGHAPLASAWTTVRPPGSLPGQTDRPTTFYMDRVHQFRKSSCENVRGQHTPKFWWHRRRVTPVHEGTQVPPQPRLGPACACSLLLGYWGLPSPRRAATCLQRIVPCFRISKSFYFW